MFAFLAFVAFLFAALDEWLGWAVMMAIGGMLLSLHLLWPIGPALPSWPRRR